MREGVCCVVFRTGKRLRGGFLDLHRGRICGIHAGGARDTARRATGSSAPQGAAPGSGAPALIASSGGAAGANRRFLRPLASSA